MAIQIERVEYRDIEAMRDLYRQEAACQIIHDSALTRGRADAFRLLWDGQVAGYGAVWNRYHPGQLLECYILPAHRRHALPLGRALIAFSGATRIEAQTNLPEMLQLLYDCATDISPESVLFHDAGTTYLPCPDGARFRCSAPDDTKSIFTHHHEPVGNWVLEVDGAIVATGGFLCHYNPPYGDIFMEVDEPVRRRGYGSYLVQELKRACYAAGKRPAARCDPSNHASRQTLQKAGFLPCGYLLTGKVREDA